MKEILYPPFLQWEVTPNCNHDCRHCYNYWRKDKERECETPDNHLDIAKKIVEQHPLSVVITGGEPLLVFDKIKDSIILLKEAGIRVTMNTNATLATDEIAKFLAEQQMSVFVSLPCSVPEVCDDITNVKGSLERISEGIKTFLKNNVPVAVNMVVSKRNIDYIYDTAKYAKEVLNVKRFFASRVSKPINSDKEFIKELLSKEEVLHMCDELMRISQELKLDTETATPMPVCMFTDNEMFQKFSYNKTCGAGRNSYGIDTMGNIKACPRDEEIYGNILTDNFQDVWKKMESWRTDEYLPKECRSCNVKSNCRGSCRLDAYPMTGSRDSLDPLTCLENVPVNFTKKKEKYDFPMDQVFDISKNIRFVEEKHGWRASFGNDFTIITDKLKSFLISRTKFCISDFMKEYNVEYAVANDVVNVLQSKNIVRFQKS